MKTVGLFSRKKKLTKEQREELDKAREELRKKSKLREEEIKKQREYEEHRREAKNSPTGYIKNQDRIPYDIQAMEKRIENELRKKQESFNDEASKLHQKIDNLKTTKQKDTCSFSGCTNKAGFLSGKRCKFCDNPYCLEHIQLEKHECMKTTPVKHLRKSWIRKYGLDISTGLYGVSCDQCGFHSEAGRMIDLAEDDRKDHIMKNGCDEKKVFLEQWE